MDNTSSDTAEMDMELLAVDFDNYSLEEMGIELPKIKEEKMKDLSDELKETYEVVVECENEQEQEETFNKLNEMGYKCRLLTL
jgi:hypothetical protein